MTVGDDGSFTYTPAPGYVGGDFFAYQATALSGDYATGGVALKIAVPPSASIAAPTAGGTYVAKQVVPTSFSCTEGLGGTGLSSCSDSPGHQSLGQWHRQRIPRYLDCGKPHLHGDCRLERRPDGQQVDRLHGRARIAATERPENASRGPPGAAG